MNHRVDITHTGIQRFRPAIYGVLIQDGQVLLVRAPKTFLGVVGFPGGGIELGEAPLDDPELGYRLKRSAWGKGYATEGSQALIDKAGFPRPRV